MSNVGRQSRDLSSADLLVQWSEGGGKPKELQESQQATERESSVPLICS